jgi:hypothetical protein
MILKPIDPSSGSTKVTEIRTIPTQHTLDIDRRHRQYNPCKHNRLLVNEERGLVICQDCEEEMSPLEGMKLLCRRIWWEENIRERQIEYDLKRVSKVQSAALICLYEAGITPEKYVQRWQKEHIARTKSQEVKADTPPPLIASAILPSA